MIRPATSTVNPGEVTTNPSPVKTMIESTMIVVRRPIASDNLPPINAPTADANTSQLVTKPVCTRVSPSSWAIGPSAPLDTTVS
jgi:hypothetical protein